MIHPAGFMAARNVAALSLDRTFSQAARILDGDQTGLDLQVDDFTVEALINANILPGSGQTYTIASKYLGITNRGWAFVLHNNSGTLQLRLLLGAGSFSYEAVNWTPSSDTWYHVAVHNYELLGNRYVAFIVDGSRVGDNQVRSWANIQDSDYDFCIGSIYGGDYFHGMIDEVRIWTVLRGTSTINTYKHQIIQSAPGLIGSYHFPYNLQDSSGVGNHLYNQGGLGYVANDLAFY